MGGPSGKSDYPWDRPRATLWTFHCLYQTVGVCPAGAGGGAEAGGGAGAGGGAEGDPEEEMMRLAMALSLSQQPPHHGTGDGNGSVGGLALVRLHSFYLHFFLYMTRKVINHKLGYI